MRSSRSSFPPMRKNTLQRDNNPSRLVGLGHSPFHNAGSVDSRGNLVGVGQTVANDNVVNSVLSCGFTQVPVIEYVTWTVDLPVPQNTIAGTFGDTIRLLNEPDSVPGVTSVDSSFVHNGILQVDMLVIGFGVHAFAEPTSGTQIGNYINPAPTAGAVNISPDAYTQNDIISGSLGANIGTGGAVGATTITPALLEWGGCCQEALWHLMNAYQFLWIMQQRFNLIQELCADVAYFGSYAEAVAAGSSSQAFQRIVNRVNTKYQSSGIGAPGAFVPINATRIGSVSTPTTPAAATNHGVFHPTRAYDQLDVTWGGLRAQGMTGMLQPFRKLFKPVLLEAGLPIGMQLQAQDEYHQLLMQQYLSNNDTLGGTVSTVTVGPTTSGLTSTSANEFLELTLDATPVTVPQQVMTDRVLMKGGAMQLAILIKGFEVWGPWKKYILNTLVPNNVVQTASTSGTSGS